MNSMLPKLHSYFLFSQQFILPYVSLAREKVTALKVRSAMS